MRLTNMRYFLPMRRSRGFTLIELLVAIAVIAVLISLLVPGLKVARRRAFDVKCQANLKQQITAWHAYINDFKVFPVARSEEIKKWMGQGSAAASAPVGLQSSINWSHSGVHWYGRTGSGDFNVPLALAQAERPVNIYLSGARAIEGAWPTFECPLDDGSRDTVTNNPNVWVNVGPSKDRKPGGARGTRMYDQLGTSYEANDWMYCKPGSFYGVWDPNDPKKDYFMWWLGPQHMVTPPSRFVTIGDSGPFAAGRYTTEYINQNPTRHGWWHGIQFGNLAFFDGSVRRTAMGNVTTRDYSFYMDETKHVGVDARGYPPYRMIRKQ